MHALCISNPPWLLSNSWPSFGFALFQLALTLFLSCLSLASCHSSDFSLHLHGNLFVVPPPSSFLIPNPSTSLRATVPCLVHSRLNTSLHPLLPSPTTHLLPPPPPQLPCLASRFSFSILFLLCRFRFLKASLRWMANGAPLSGGERKKEKRNIQRESEREGGYRRTETPDCPSDNKVFDTKTPVHRSALCLNYIDIYNRLNRRKRRN